MTLSIQVYSIVNNINFFSQMVANQQTETSQEMGNKEANKDKNRLRQVVPCKYCDWYIFTPPSPPLPLRFWTPM